MIGFKTIEDFTFDECFVSIERCHTEGIAPDEELLKRYNSLLKELKAQEKRDYPTVKTIVGLERYIKKYSNPITTKKYKPQYLAQARQELVILKRQRAKKAVLFVISCVSLICLIIFIGYKGPDTTEIPDSILFTYNKQDSVIYFPGVHECKIDSAFFIVERNGNYFTFKLPENPSNSREASIVFLSSDTFFNYPIGFRKKSKILHIVQQNGTSDYLIVEFDNDQSYGYRLGSGDVYRIDWQGGKLRFIIHTNNKSYGFAITDFPPEVYLHKWIAISSLGYYNGDNIRQEDIVIEANHSCRPREAFIIFQDTDSLFSKRIKIIQEEDPSAPILCY